MLRQHGYLSPVLFQLLGLAMLIGFVAYWAFTGKESALLVGAALSLIGIGSANGAIVTIRNEITQQGREHIEHIKEVAEQ